MVSVPAPLIRAPMAFRKLARSTTWGSLAAFRSTVLPLALTAASITLMVPPTVGRSKYTAAPFSLPLAQIMPLDSLTSAPSARKPLMCWSKGRLPMAQPPG